MSSVLEEPPAVLGHQRPSFLWLPPGISPDAWFDDNGDLHVEPGTTAADSIELAAMAGLVLDPWQQFVLACALAERPDGQWAALRVGLMLSRQNGKDAVIEARELAGLFLFGERLMTHSAHRWDTALEHLNRLVERIESTPDLDDRVAKVNRAHGDEGITLRDGARIQFRTRTKIGGVGFSADLLVLNEAMDIPEAAHGSLVPTLSARPNCQIWYAGSAVDQEVMENGVVFARLRRDAHRAAEDPRAAYSRARRMMWAEWSADEDAYERDRRIADDPAQWARANPGLGTRITSDFIETVERAGLDERRFLAQRLGIGDWPEVDTDAWVIDEAKWDACVDPESGMLDPVVFVADVSPDRSRASICAAGRRRDGRIHGEVIKRGRGTAWIVDTLVRLQTKFARSVILVDGAGPVSSLFNRFDEEKLRYTPVTTSEATRAFGAFVDAVEDVTFAHRDNPALRAALAGASKRGAGEAWAWSRKKSTVDITPLVAVTLATFGASRRRGAAALVNPDDILEEEGADQVSDFRAPLDDEDFE